MKSLHNTPHGEAMLELIDKLRGIQGLQKQIDLPQIVVVGQQSSGKSSVLNAISGLDFPTHHSICTRFPTELRLRRDERSTAKAYIKNDQGENYEDFDAAWSNIDPNRLQEELPKLIESAQDLLIGKDSVAKVSSRSLVIQVSGPSLDHLTLVDLPGLFAAGRDGQSRIDIEAVEKIITSYIDQPLSIVLAVINAADDPENHKILQIIKERKDRASKTLGVLTKPDLLQGNDDDQERNRAAMLVHDDWNLGHGWHVVRNLKPNEIADGAVRDVLEDKFFAVNKVWKRGRELGRVGNAALKERLSLILGNSMSESLPDIGLQVHFELERVEDALTKMGDARLSSNDQIRYLQEQAKVFQESIGLSLSNEPPLFGSQRCFRLRSCLEEHYAAFVEQFDKNGAVWKLDMKSSVSSAGPDAVKKAIDCRTGETVIVTATDLMDFLESQIQKNRIKILPNLVPHQWSAYLFQQQRARWLALSQQFIDKVFSAVEQTVNAAMADIRLEDGAKLDIGKTIRGRLSERKADADRKIRELHRPYEQPQLSCYTNRYKDTLKTNSIDTTERFQIIDTVRSAELYYHIASEMFVENVIQLAAEACLVDQLEDLFSPRMVLSWDTGTVERLGGEGDGNKSLRNQYAADLTGLKQAHTLMLDFKARLGLWTPSASHPVAELDGPLRGLSIDTPAQPAVVVEDTTRVKKLHPERDGWHPNGRKNGGRWVTNLGRPLPTPAPSVTDDDDVFDRRSSANSSAYSSPEPKRSTRLS